MYAAGLRLMVWMETHAASSVPSLGAHAFNLMDVGTLVSASWSTFFGYLRLVLDTPTKRPKTQRYTSLTTVWGALVACLGTPR